MLTPLHRSLIPPTLAHCDCDGPRRPLAFTQSQPIVYSHPQASWRVGIIVTRPQLSGSSRLGRPLAMADAPRPQLSVSLIVSDCAALVVYGLLASALKAFALAGSDLLSPGFDLAADLASFDLDATMRYVNVEYFAAASLALGWLVGGTVSGACSVEWRGLSAEARWRLLLTGWLSAAPLACLCKYGLLAQQQLPVLGRSEQAKLLEAQLAGLTAPNVLADALGMLVVLVLWRRLLLFNDWVP